VAASIYYRHSNATSIYLRHKQLATLDPWTRPEVWWSGQARYISLKYIKYPKIELKYSFMY
jgi:hypothetical protein